MEKSKRNLELLIFSAFILLLPHVIISTATALDQEKQSVFDKFRGLYSVVTSSSMSCWQKLKTLVNDVQLRYFPPSLEPKIEEEEIEEKGSKEWMKEAVKKSLGSSKSTVEETAKSAASAVGEVVHKTKEKVAKKQCSGDGCPHDEL